MVMSNNGIFSTPQNLPSFQIGANVMFDAPVKDFYLQDLKILAYPLVGLEVGGNLLFVTDHFIYDPQYRAWRIKFFKDLNLVEAGLAPPERPEVRVTSLPLHLIRDQTVRLVAYTKEEMSDDRLIYYTTGREDF